VEIRGEEPFSACISQPAEYKAIFGSIKVQNSDVLYQTFAPDFVPKFVVRIVRQ
jgi:hypothetical protein